MNRRAFFAAVAAAVPAMALDPDRLLWVPGQRSYFDIVRPNALGRVVIGTRLGQPVTFPLTYGLKGQAAIRIDGVWVPN